MVFIANTKTIWGSVFINFPAALLFLFLPGEDFRDASMGYAKLPGYITGPDSVMG